MFNVIDHLSRIIKHNQNKIFGGLNAIISCDFYQTPPIKDYWILYSLNDIINASALNF
jgi:hypothetical protein